MSLLYPCLLILVANCHLHASPLPFFFLLLFIYLIYFNWRIITLQNCEGFCHISTWIGHGYTYVPFPLPFKTLVWKNKTMKKPLVCRECVCEQQRLCSATCFFTQHFVLSSPPSVQIDMRHWVELLHHIPSSGYKTFHWSILPKTFRTVVPRFLFLPTNAGMLNNTRMGGHLSGTLWIACERFCCVKMPEELNWKGHRTFNLDLDSGLSFATIQGQAASGSPCEVLSPSPERCHPAGRLNTLQGFQRSQAPKNMFGKNMMSVTKSISSSLWESQNFIGFPVVRYIQVEWRWETNTVPSL